MKNKKKLDGLSSFLNELPVSREIIKGLVSGTQKVRTDVTELVTAELKKYIDNFNPRPLIDYILGKYDFEINATVSFRPKKKSKK